MVYLSSFCTGLQNDHCNINIGLRTKCVGVTDWCYQFKESLHTVVDIDICIGLGQNRAFSISLHADGHRGLAQSYLQDCLNGVQSWWTWWFMTILWLQWNSEIYFPSFFALFLLFSSLLLNLRIMYLWVLSAKCLPIPIIKCRTHRAGGAQRWMRYRQVLFLILDDSTTSFMRFFLLCNFSRGDTMKLGFKTMAEDLEW